MMQRRAGARANGETGRDYLSAQLDKLIGLHGQPRTIVSDNGTGLTPRDELLNETVFANLADARRRLSFELFGSRTHPTGAGPEGLVINNRLVNRDFANEALERLQPNGIQSVSTAACDGVGTGTNGSR